MYIVQSSYEYVSDIVNATEHTLLEIFGEAQHDFSCSNFRFTITEYVPILFLLHLLIFGNADRRWWNLFVSILAADFSDFYIREKLFGFIETCIGMFVARFYYLACCDFGFLCVCEGCLNNDKSSRGGTLTSDVKIILIALKENIRKKDNSIYC